MMPVYTQSTHDRNELTIIGISVYTYVFIWRANFPRFPRSDTSEINVK